MSEEREYIDQKMAVANMEEYKRAVIDQAIDMRDVYKFSEANAIAYMTGVLEDTRAQGNEVSKAVEYLVMSWIKDIYRYPNKQKT